VEKSEGCEYLYKGIVLKDGDRIIKARILGQEICRECGKNETLSLPYSGKRVVLDAENNDGLLSGVIMFDGKIVDLRDAEMVQ